MKRKGITESPDRLNVIVEGSIIEGDFSAESNVRIDGKIIGNVKCSAKLVLGQTGILKGTLTCQEADIEGTVEGDIIIKDSLTLRSNAKIIGNIVTSRLTIEDGAEFSGNCKMSSVGISTEEVVY